MIVIKRKKKGKINEKKNNICIAAIAMVTLSVALLTSADTGYVKFPEDYFTGFASYYISLEDKKGESVIMIVMRMFFEGIVRRGRKPSS